KGSWHDCCLLRAGVCSKRGLASFTLPVLGSATQMTVARRFEVDHYLHRDGQSVASHWHRRRVDVEAVTPPAQLGHDASPSDGEIGSAQGGGFRFAGRDPPAREEEDPWRWCFRSRSDVAAVTGGWPTSSTRFEPDR